MALFDLRTDVFFFLIARYNDLKLCGIESRGMNRYKAVTVCQKAITQRGRGNGQLEDGRRMAGRFLCMCEPAGDLRAG